MYLCSNVHVHESVCTFAMYVCMYACYACMHACILYLCIYARIHFGVCVWLCMYLCIQACIYLRMYSCMHVKANLCLRAGMCGMSECVRISVYMYIIITCVCLHVCQSKCMPVCMLRVCRTHACLLVYARMHSE